ncbi:MAG: helix-turn-helix domain containing protein [Candidatus Tectomicrobia bacterium]|nr:helix-turn-helix domain containing protein [Candidatus Tectomicrobia bacterium]
MARRGRPRARLNLDPEEQRRLSALATERTQEKRLAQRAKLILLAAQGRTWKEICQHTGLSLCNSLKWQRRFLQHRLDGLNDLPRGPRARISTREKMQVLELARSAPPDGNRRWTLQMLATVSNLSPASVYRILSTGMPATAAGGGGNGSPHGDPSPQQARIVGFYLNREVHALALAVDRNAPRAGTDESGRPREDSVRGEQAPRLVAAADQVEPSTLLAALAGHENGDAPGAPSASRHGDLLTYLRRLYRKFPRVRLHIVCDKLTERQRRRLQEWASSRRRLTLHFTTTSSAWLDHIAIWFTIFSTETRRGGAAEPSTYAVDMLLEHIKHLSDSAQPFHWTFAGKL